MEIFAKDVGKRSNMGLAGPALIHLQHQQEAERLGDAHVATVRENLTLLKEYSDSNRYNRDLEEWIDAWNTAEAQSTATKSAPQDSLPSIAQILVGYVAEAQAWKQRQSAPEQAN